MNGWGGGMMGGLYGGTYMWLFILVVLAVVVYFVVKGTKPANQDSATHEIPLDILKRRYAKGEITKDDYERLRKDIER